MGKVVSKKDIKEILEQIGVNRDSKNPYLIYKEDMGKIDFTIASQPEITLCGEKDVMGNHWNQRWAKVEMKIKVHTKGFEHIKVLEMGGAKEGKPDGAMFKAMAINFERNNLDFDDIVGTRWILYKESNSRWFEIEYVGVDEDFSDEDVESEQPKPEKKKQKEPESDKEKPKASDMTMEIVTIVKSLKDEPEFTEGIHKDKLVTSVALRSSYSMDEVDSVMDTLVKKKFISIDDEDIVVIH